MSDAIEAAARAIYEALPNYGMAWQPNTRGGHSQVRRRRRAHQSLTARCEWAPGEYGLTRIGDLKSSTAQYLLREYDCSASMFLAKYNHITSEGGKGE